MIFLREDLRNLLIPSTNPLAHGEATATNLCLILLVLVKSENSREVNAVPLSETISLGGPNICKRKFKHLIASLDPVVFVAKSQINLVNASLLLVCV